MPYSEATSVRVFVVGDEERTVSMVLRRWGHEVDTVDGRAYPILEARRFQPDLVLIDVGQTAFDGLAHVRRFRRRAEFGAVPLAVYADFVHNGGCVQMVPSGEGSVALKRLPPVELARVLDEIRQLIVIPKESLLDQAMSRAVQIDAERQVRGARRARWAGPSKEKASPAISLPASTADSCRVVLLERQGESLHSVFPLLKRMRFDVAACFSSDDCVNYARLQAPDLVVLNAGRSAYFAYETARRIRESAGENRPLVIRISSKDDRMQEFLAAEVGIARQLTTPLRALELVAVLRELEGSLTERQEFTAPDVARTTG